MLCVSHHDFKYNMGLITSLLGYTFHMENMLRYISFQALQSGLPLCRLDQVYLTLRVALQTSSKNGRGPLP